MTLLLRQEAVEAVPSELAVRNTVAVKRTRSVHANLRARRGECVPTEREDYCVKRRCLGTEVRLAVAEERTAKAYCPRRLGVKRRVYSAKESSNNAWGSAL